MNPKYYTLLLLFGIALSAFSQDRVNYTYDAAGNRLACIIDMGSLRSAAIADREDEADEQEIVYSDKIDRSDIRIYPNPTKGILKIEITPIEEGNPIQIQLYDISGKILVNEPNAAPFTELNISDKPAGTYILNIFSDNRTTQWKIIKQ